MTEAWLASIAPEDERCLGRLRLCPSLSLCRFEGRLWLRGSELQSLAAELAAPSSARWYRLDARGRMIPLGKRVPVGPAPPGPWSPLVAALAVEAPVAALPGRLTGQGEARLALATEERPAAMVLLGFDAWADFALSAAALRLAPLSFALSGDGRVAVRGQPLPPLPGQRLWVDGCLALPLGRELRPALDAASWRLALGLAPDELALFSDDGSYERLAASGFVDASRAAVRASREGGLGV